MNNSDITQRRDQAIKEANAVYDNIVQNQTDLVNNQSKQIDNYLVNSESAINQSVNNNISALQNAQSTAQRQRAETNQRLMNNYNNNYVNSVDESSRIGALNGIRNRMATEESSVDDMIQEYNNQIAQAKITGQSIIAQQALDMLKEKFNLHSRGMQNINNALIAKGDNQQTLTKMYGNLDNAYSNANNTKLNREEKARQFNEQLAYNNQQLKTQKDLKEQQYQLDLKDARDAYYSRYSSGGRSYGSSGGSYGSGGYLLDGSSGGSESASSGNTQFHSLLCPYGLSKTGDRVYNELARVQEKYGYVSANYLSKVINGSGLSEKDKSLIGNSFKPGAVPQEVKSSGKNTTSKTVKNTVKGVIKASALSNPVTATAYTVNKLFSNLFKKKK